MKKKLNIVLLCFVLGVWGTILYRLAANYLSPGPVAAVTNGVRDVPFKIAARDTFALPAQSRDPFLGKSAISIRQLPPVRRRARPAAPGAAIPSAWPAIQYYGFIKSKDSKNELLLLRINNQLCKVRPGGTVQGITVRKVYNDSVRLVFQGNLKVLRVEK